MRQTPFGVWNMIDHPGIKIVDASSNEADAFRRLECDCGDSEQDDAHGDASSNEADAFRRLEYGWYIESVGQIKALQ